MTYPVDRGRVGGEKGARDKVTKRRRGNGTGEGKRPGTLSEEGGLYLDICAGVPEFLSLYVSADGAGLPT